MIRHQHDYGAIILCDDRFLGDGVRSHISLWLRDRVELFPAFGAATVSLTGFFKARSTRSLEALTAGWVSQQHHFCGISNGDVLLVVVLPAPPG